MTATASQHYADLLADHYGWMVGSFEARAAAQGAELREMGVVSASNDGRALDLGSGPGYGSVALARLGYRVTAVDNSPALLAELSDRAADLPVAAVEADLRDVAEVSARDGSAAAGGYAVAACLGDTLTHLDAREEVARLFADARDALAPGGLLALTFHDLSKDLAGLDRFVPVRADDSRVMTCFLEYGDPERVTVHDLVHVRGEDGGWELRKGSYRKLRLPADWVAGQLEAAGLAVTHRGLAGRMSAVAAVRR